MKLRKINLQLAEVAKAYPGVAALLNYNTSINASTTVISRASEISTKADDVKDVHEPADSEGNTIHAICTTYCLPIVLLTRTQIKGGQNCQ